MKTMSLSKMVTFAECCKDGCAAQSSLLIAMLSLREGVQETILCSCDEHVDELLQLHKAAAIRMTTPSGARSEAT